MAAGMSSSLRSPARSVGSAPPAGPGASCGARCTVETAAHLIDHVIPHVPVRQWVLSFLWPLRMLFAARPETLTRCLAVVVRCIETHLVQRAGLRRTSGARTGMVTLIQRHGSAANLHVQSQYPRCASR